MRSYPKAEPPVELTTTEEKKAWWQNHVENHRGALHRVRFHRIILDEAQAIKNYKSWTSIACRALISDIRWALSGTPIQNNLQELFPYFQYLRIQHTGDFRLFCSNYLGPDGQPTEGGMTRIQTMLTKFMLRRTHTDRFLGAPLIKLPDHQVNVCWVDFNEVERNVYQIVRQRILARINRISQNHQLNKNYGNVLTMLLRLRQLTGHILTIETPIRELLEREDIEKLRELSEIRANSDGEQKKTILELRNMLYEQDEKGKEKYGQGADHEDEQRSGQPEQSSSDEPREETLRQREFQPSNSVGRHHGLSFDFRQYLQSLYDEENRTELMQRTRCGRCNNIPEQPQVTNCFHIYCLQCLVGLQISAAERDETSTRCVLCAIVFTNTKPCDQIDLRGFGKLGQKNLGMLFESDREFHGEHAKRSGKGSKKKASDNANSWIEKAGIDILPSSKTLAVKSQIINWIEETPDVKVIIYTQFLDM